MNAFFCTTVTASAANLSNTDYNAPLINNNPGNLGASIRKANSGINNFQKTFGGSSYRTSIPRMSTALNATKDDQEGESAEYDIVEADSFVTRAGAAVEILNFQNSNANADANADADDNAADDEDKDGDADDASNEKSSNEHIAPKSRSAVK